MKKKVLLLIIILLSFSFLNVNAGKRYRYTVCQSGCDYNNLDDALEAESQSQHITDIDIMDDNIYEITRDYYIDSILPIYNRHDGSNYHNDININGNNHTINAVELNIYTTLGRVNISNLNVKIYDPVDIMLNLDSTTTDNYSINFDNVNISRSLDASEDYFYPGFVPFVWSKYGTQSITDINIKNSTITGFETAIAVGWKSDYGRSYPYNLTVDNCDLSENKWSYTESDENSNLTVTFKNSILHGIKSSTTNVSIDKSNTFTYPVIYITDWNDLDTNIDNIGTIKNGAIDPHSLIEEYQQDSEYSLVVSDWYNSQNNTNRTGRHGHIYIDQEKDISINMDEYNNDINVLDLFTDALNRDTENMEWTSSDETVATIENGVIKPLKSGNATMTLHISNTDTTYKINVTVLKKSLPEKIDNMTIEVPLTDKRIKVWVLVSIIMLFGIIGIIIYSLIKNKKSN